MYRAAEEVREPRGISWQNWTANCKDILVSNRTRVLIVTLVVLAAVGGGLYARQARSGYAGQTPRPASPRTEINLRDESPQPATGASQLPSAATQHSTDSSPATATMHTTSLPCNQTAAAKARLAYSTTVAAENTYHSLQLSLVSATSTVTQLLDAPTATRPLTTETYRHTAALQADAATLSTALAAAHCE